MDEIYIDDGVFYLNRNAAVEIAKMNLKGRQYSILFNLFSQLKNDNYLFVDEKNIAQKLQIKISDVSTAMKVFQEKNIIADVGRQDIKIYLMNPDIAFKGSDREKVVKNFKTLLAEKEKNFLDADIRTD